jgi:assimilatory nitrate reductase catalytic subunit
MLDGLVWWSKSRVAGGWLFELAGSGAVDADELLPEGERIEAVDLARGMRRIAAIDGDGRFVAGLYITRNGQLPERDWIAAQLGQRAAKVPEMLAARPSTPLPDRGAMVCVCHGIGAKQIFAAVEGGSDTVAAIGKACAAGTNCGSCRPAIARLLRTWNDELAEAAQ